MRQDYFALLCRALLQTQQKGVVRHCIGIMRSRALTKTFATWRSWAAAQRSLGDRLQQATAQRHAKLRLNMLRRWAVWAVAAAAQHQQLLRVVATMRASSLARCDIDSM